MGLKDYFYSMRPKLITSFTCVLIGVLCTVNFNPFLINYEKLLIVFISFQLFYSGIYIINDIIDFNKDKLSPRKKNRPIASGKINRKNAFIFSMIIMIIGLVIGIYLVPTLIFFEFLFLFYNLIYSYFLKKIPYIDTLSGALTYTLRFIMGVYLFGSFNFYYLTVIVFTASISIILVKRVKEIQNNEKVNHPIKYYSIKGIKIFWILEIFVIGILFLLANGVEKIIIGVVFVYYVLLLTGYLKSKFIKKLMEKHAD